ncbi:MAG: glycosyltransferase [Paracoccaceae bacterium]
MALQVLDEVPNAQVHILLPAGHADRIKTMSEYYPKHIQLWCCPSPAEVKRRLGGTADTALRGIGRHPQLFAEAAAFMFGAMDIEAATGARLTHIEIPDHLGYGNLILTARECGIAFQSAEVACRIHSSFTELLRFEPDYYATDSWHAARIDMEAECLRLADRIFAPLHTIGAIVERNIKLPAGKSVAINFPAVLHAAPKLEPLPEGHVPDFAFASRFQPFKRPELFIRGAVHFLDRNPGYSGSMRLMAYAFEPMYLATLRMMVPQRHSTKILFETDLPESERNARLAHSIVVQPSVYESLCLLSYEVSARQRPVLVANDCAAFANEPRWRNGDNCLMFEPSPEGLADCMQNALTWRPKVPVSFAPNPVWMRDNAVTRNPLTNTKTGVVLIGPISDPAQIPGIRALSNRAPTNWKVHVYTIGVDLQDAFDDPAITCHVADAGCQQDSFMGGILRALESDNVCLATPDALPKSNLLQAASQIDDSIVLSALSGDQDNLNCFAGRAPNLALQDSRLSASCLCLSRQDALRLLAKQGSSRRVIANLVMALQDDRLTLVIAPQIWILQQNSPFEEPDDVRLHGTQLRRAHRQIDPALHLGMVDRASASTLPLLNESPVQLTSPSFAIAPGDKVDISLPCGAKTVTLHSDAPLWGHMLRLTVVPGKEVPCEPVELTLTTHDSANTNTVTQKITLDLKRHQLVLTGPFFGNAVLEFTFERPAGASAIDCSLRRIRRLSPA